MGCDIHMVLQKKNEKTGEFETIDYDFLPGRNYELFTFLKGVRGMVSEFDDIAHDGLPKDFYTTQVNSQGDPGTYHNDFDMGEHSFGHLTLKEFCNAPTPAPEKKTKFSVNTFEDGYTVHFDQNEDEFGDLADEYEYIKMIQYGLKVAFDAWEDYGKGDDYRLVFGFDS